MTPKFSFGMLNAANHKILYLTLSFLCLIYFNDIIKLTIRSQLTCFADDTTLPVSVYPGMLHSHWPKIYYTR